MKFILINYYNIYKKKYHKSVEKYFSFDIVILVCCVMSYASYCFFFLFIMTVYDDFASLSSRNPFESSCYLEESSLLFVL